MTEEKYCLVPNGREIVSRAKLYLNQMNIELDEKYVGDFVDTSASFKIHVHDSVIEYENLQTKIRSKMISLTDNEYDIIAHFTRHTPVMFDLFPKIMINNIVIGSAELQPFNSFSMHRYLKISSTDCIQFCGDYLHGAICKFNMTTQLLDQMIYNQMRESKYLLYMLKNHLTTTTTINLDQSNIQLADDYQSFQKSIIFQFVNKTNRFIHEIEAILDQIQYNQKPVDKLVDELKHEIK